MEVVVGAFDFCANFCGTRKNHFALFNEQFDPLVRFVWKAEHFNKFRFVRQFENKGTLNFKEEAKILSFKSRKIYESLARNKLRIGFSFYNCKEPNNEQKLFLSKTRGVFDSPTKTRFLISVTF